MRKALTVIGAGIVVAAAGISLIAPAGAVILLGVAIAAAGLLLIDVRGPE